MRLEYSWKSLLIISMAAVIVMTMAALIMYYYRQRPFFADEFRVIGWRIHTSRSTGTGLHVHYDRPDRVLLVVGLSPRLEGEIGRYVEWVPYFIPANNQLRVRRQVDNLVKHVEWRRDCLIFLDRDGVPTYISISNEEFTNALHNPASVVDIIRDVTCECLQIVPDSK